MTILDVRGSKALELSVSGQGGAASTDLGSDDFEARSEAVALIAAQHAVAVDRDGRFPREAIEAIRAERLLGILVPRELGGAGASISQVADICYRLGRVCSSTAMIYAMHQTKVACLVRHGGANVWQTNLLRRLCAEQLLLASSTTEGQNGGNIRSSAAAVGQEAGRIHLERAATVISYGAQADGVVTTARRAADAASSDQVLVTFLKEDYSLEPTLGWDAMGMRGTCSGGFALKASGCSEQIVSEPYDRIHAQTMTPFAHLLWSSVWAGIAAAAVERAQAFVRKAARGANGQLPPGAAHHTKAQSSLRVLRGLIASSLDRYERAMGDERLLASIDFQGAINLLKVDASELAVATVMSAMRACGLSGYRNDSEFAIGRLLRDVLSSPIMINNDRILANISTASLMSSVPASLRG
jgi:acyl-CoA dehydrogenase